MTYRLEGAADGTRSRLTDFQAGMDSDGRTTPFHADTAPARHLNKAHGPRCQALMAAGYQESSRRSMDPYSHGRTDPKEVETDGPDPSAWSTTHHRHLLKPEKAFHQPSLKASPPITQDVHQEGHEESRLKQDHQASPLDGM